jgi:hypothetical protein
VDGRRLRHAAHFLSQEEVVKSSTDLFVIHLRLCWPSKGDGRDHITIRLDIGCVACGL